MTHLKLLEKPIIFIGNPRSGTSVISEIVMRHNEIGFPSQYQDRFRKITTINILRRMFDNGLWRVHGQKAQLNKVSFFNRYVFRPVEGYKMWNSLLDGEINFGKSFLVDETLSNESIQKIRLYFNEILQMQGKTRLAFKTTGPSRIQFLKSIFPDAQFVLIQRNPVPNVSSLLKVEFWKSNGMNKLWWTGCYSNEELAQVEEICNDPIALTSFQLRKIQEVTDREIKQFDPSILIVKYEDFIVNPLGSVEEILDFVGLAADQACSDYFKHNKIYNQNKNDDNYFKPVEINKIKKYLR